MSALSGHPGSPAWVRGRPFVLLLVGFAAATLGCEVGAGPLVEQVDTIGIRQPVAEVVVEGGSGSVIVEAWVGGTVMVSRTVRYRGSNPPKLASPVRDRTLRLSADCAGVADCSVDHRISVPREKAVTVRATSGAILIRGIAGRVRIEAVSSSITVEELSGNLEITTGSGLVIASGLAASSLRVQGDSGNLEIIFTKPPDSVEIQTRSGGVRLTVPNEGYRIVAISQSGSVSVGLTSDPSAVRGIRVETGSGGIAISR